MALLGCFITVLFYFDSFVILFFHNNMKEKVVYMFTIYEHVHWNFYDGMSKMIKRLQIYNVFAHRKSVCQNQLYCKHFVTCCFESLRCCATIKYRRRYLINMFLRLRRWNQNLMCVSGNQKNNWHSLNNTDSVLVFLTQAELFTEHLYTLAHMSLIRYACNMMAY